ncbi:MAG TPA: aromatic ring-hydroxylating dioxygenase subunit alpha [Planctomycetota bacterium]|nr:aromatic ring-hydroxylating dioxygenase subunit alpha [Planctomycetota bacterium]
MSDPTFPALRRTWQPVALSRDLVAGIARPYRLLDHDLAIVRLADGVAAFPDRCPHRGARLSGGTAVDVHLACPYHGWRFARDGGCTLIPSLGPGSALARGVRLASYATCERYGFVWVRLDETGSAPIPDIPEFEDPRWTYMVADPTPFAAGFRREIENYLDMAHFAVAHAQTLGRGADALVPRYDVAEQADGLRMDANFPAAPGADVGKLQRAHRRTQRWHRPNVTTIRQSWPDGDERVLVHVPSPTSAESCTVFWSLAISPAFSGPPPAEQMAFAVRVLDEDRRLCESQIPREAPLEADGDIGVPADRFALAFRKRLREWSG